VESRECYKKRKRNIAAASTHKYKAGIYMTRKTKAPFTDPPPPKKGGLQGIKDATESKTM
jgi:hypothetical protein